MSVSASIRAFEMRDVLVSKFQAEAHAGGKLATLASVTKSAQFSTELVPALGVQLVGWTKVEPYGQRDHIIRVEFEIILAANSVRGARVANLGDAMETLRPLIDAGDALNGIVPILNSPSIFALPDGSSQPIAMQSAIGSAEFTSEIQEGEGQSVWCYFVQRYSADTIASY